MRVERKGVLLWTTVAIGLVITGVIITVIVVLIANKDSPKKKKVNDDDGNKSPSASESESETNGADDDLSADDALRKYQLRTRKFWTHQLAKGRTETQVRQHLSQAVAKVDAHVLGGNLSSLRCPGQFPTMASYSQKRAELIWDVLAALSQGLIEEDARVVFDPWISLLESCEGSVLPHVLQCPVTRPFLDARLHYLGEPLHSVCPVEIYRLCSKLGYDREGARELLGTLTGAVQDVDLYLTIKKHGTLEELVEQGPTKKFATKVHKNPGMHVLRFAFGEAMASVLEGASSIPDAYTEYAQGLQLASQLPNTEKVSTFDSLQAFQNFMDEHFPPGLLSQDLPDQSNLLSSARPRGLIRRGCNCYALATLQCLATFQPLLDAHLRGVAERELPPDHRVLQFLDNLRAMQDSSEPALDLTDFLSVPDYMGPFDFVSELLNETFAASSAGVKKSLTGLAGYLGFRQIKYFADPTRLSSRRSLRYGMRNPGYPYLVDASKAVLGTVLSFGPLLIVSNPLSDSIYYDLAPVLETDGTNFPADVFCGPRGKRLRCELQAFAYSSTGGHRSWAHCIALVKRGTQWYQVNDDHVVERAPPLTAAEQTSDGKAPFVSYYLCRHVDA